ncbi:hypothetical protein [Polyangium sp. y55x31]|uniref:hypothetical protein n=1 Tax=Polyangium sp. y55x31 TaxID=3042688 RepID=UPI002482AA46|nr:hypothetical protein [Polyangium sp. y55x31]MDI1475099.1 hypothetical protein [Polyangium sp. y55x31]
MLWPRSSLFPTFVVSLATCSALVSACTLDQSGSMDPAGPGSASASTGAGMGGAGASGGGGAAGTGGAGANGGAGGTGNGSSSSGGGLTKNDGAPCLVGIECNSGHCTDGVCCNEECKDACHACNQPGDVGSCQPVPVGADACSTPGELCDAEGTCACGVAKPPTGQSCPGGWLESSPGTCLKTCGGGQCRNTTIDCPAGFHCVVDCNGMDACSDGTVINCPAGHACEVICSAKNTCQGMGGKVQCSADGPCKLTCSGSHGTCQDLTFTCGDNLCEASCTSTYKATVVKGNACSSTSNCQ